MLIVEDATITQKSVYFSTKIVYFLYLFVVIETMKSKQIWCPISLRSISN